MNTINWSGKCLIAGKSLVLLVWMVLGLTACDRLSDTESAMQTVPAAEVINVKDAYIRAMPPGQKVSALFLTLENTADTDHALLKASGDVSAAIELHAHTHENGVMKMGQVDQVAIPAGGVTALAPGGYHIMLIGLKKTLKPGDKVALQLTFEDGSMQAIEAEVKRMSVK